MHSTTILAVRRGKQVAMGGDGQVSLGDTILKGNACKVRRLYHGKILVGFAGGTADALTLFDWFSVKLQKHQGHLMRASVELAKDWRSDKIMRKLEAWLIAADAGQSLIITGAGDVIEPEGDVMAIGSGGEYARAAALALVGATKLDAPTIVKNAMGIAAKVCVYTNDQLVLETLN